MPTDAEITAKFWKALRDDRTVMLGLAGGEENHAQPMTAQFDGERDAGPIWFFTSKKTDLARALESGSGIGAYSGASGAGGARPALAQFAAKGHDLFASIEGELRVEPDRARVDQLWNRFVAAWFEGGKTDPDLQLLRFDLGRAQIWLNEHSLVAGFKLLIGGDPKQEFKDKIADVSLA